MCLRNTFKSFLELICFRLVQYNPDFIILEGQNSKLHDLWIFEPATKPQNQHDLSLETPGHLTKIKKKPGTCLNNLIFVNIGISLLKTVESIHIVFPDFEYVIFIKMCEDGDRKMMKIG